MSTDRTEAMPVTANGLVMNVAQAGDGPPVLLLHGFPHTWRVWDRIIPDLSRAHRVIAPDLRGLGRTSCQEGSFDAQTIVADLAALLDALEIGAADVVAIDLGVAPALLLALLEPTPVRRLVVMEGLAGQLPGAEDFLRNGPPWWFGFHAVPGLAEQVVLGNEIPYFDFFLDAGTMGRGMSAAFRDSVIAGYSGAESLRCAFEHYRALPDSARQILQATAARRLTVPTMTIGAFPVGEALFGQLAPIADDLVGRLLPDCGHIIPQSRPSELLALLLPFLA